MAARTRGGDGRLRRGQQLIRSFSARRPWRLGRREVTRSPLLLHGGAGCGKKNEAWGGVDRPIREEEGKKVRGRRRTNRTPHFSPKHGQLEYFFCLFW
ncbi:hypothetical protein BRADI_5g05206v3 [Brachypodium distachyon]|uniref:Uncharacterized protein n=1 Tax=Brachypodium distachyon TaxID=15368 RepID=A0A2K2CFK2_BRADI|nr:hypothetical protein BRADI_5g05206v3 [Brachypodium distachyon]